MIVINIIIIVIVEIGWRPRWADELSLTGRHHTSPSSSSYATPGWSTHGHHHHHHHQHNPHYLFPLVSPLGGHLIVIIIIIIVGIFVIEHHHHLLLLLLEACGSPGWVITSSHQLSAAAEVNCSCSSSLMSNLSTKHLHIKQVFPINLLIHLQLLICL